MTRVTYQNRLTGRIQMFDERETVRARILENAGWFKVTAPQPVETKGKAGKPQPADDLTEIKGVGYDLADELKALGIDTFEKLANAEIDDLTAINGVGKATAINLKAGAAKLRMLEQAA